MKDWMATMKDESAATWWVRIYISGPLAIAEQVCREECLREGLCVTIEPTKFIYTGGEELGVVVGLVNYPRFPATPEVIDARAERIARFLMLRMCQHSVLIVSPTTSHWISNRE